MFHMTNCGPITNVITVNSLKPLTLEVFRENDPVPVFLNEWDDDQPRFEDYEDYLVEVLGRLNPCDQGRLVMYNIIQAWGRELHTGVVQFKSGHRIQIEDDFTGPSTRDRRDQRVSISCDTQYLQAKASDSVSMVADLSVSLVWALKEAARAWVYFKFGSESFPDNRGDADELPIRRHTSNRSLDDNRILMIEAEQDFIKGIAYGTTQPARLRHTIDRLRTICSIESVTQP